MVLVRVRPVVKAGGEGDPPRSAVRGSTVLMCDIPRNLDGSFLMASRSDVAAQLVQLPELARRETFSVAGVESLLDESSASKIPNLWFKLLQCLPLGGQEGEETFGVCWKADADGGALHYMAAVGLKPGAKIPNGLERLDVATQTYAVFRLTLSGEELHPQIQSAMRTLWSKLFPASGLKHGRGPLLEVYPPGFASDQPGATMDFFVPVQD
jgi:AraC family transcriptional regulator